MARRAVSRGCAVKTRDGGAGAGVAWLQGGRFREIAHTVVNAVAVTSGIVCDGAKSSCAAKIACAVDCAATAWELASRGHVFHSGEGLVMKDAERTIEMVGRMAREGMRSTDTEILKIIIGHDNLDWPNHIADDLHCRNIGNHVIADRDAIEQV